MQEVVTDSQDEKEAHEDRDVKDENAYLIDDESKMKDQMDYGTDVVGTEMEQKSADDGEGSYCYSDVDKDRKNDLKNSLYTREELIDYFEKLKIRKCPEKDKIMIGMVGFPNVGKSSTINALLGDKKTSVSSTPGKTKHFQV